MLYNTVTEDDVNDLNNLGIRAQVLAAPSDKVAITGNYDQKDVNFDQQVYGGLQTDNAALISLQRSVLAPQTYTADVDDTNLSGQLTVAYKVATSINTYGTYATGFKSVGLNLNGVPTDAQDRPVLAAATVRPEDVRHFEVGVKTEPFRGVTANLSVYNTEIKDFQAQVVNAGVGVLRGYLANAEKVRVRGVEFDGNARLGDCVSLYGAAAYTDGRYLSFPDAPPPLEDTGAPQVKDISGSVLPGISTWALSFGAEYAGRAQVLGRPGQFFAAVDTSYRSSFSSSATASRYLVVDGYGLVNTRVGFRWSGRLDALPVVAQPLRQGLPRAADGGARQHRALRRAAGRPPHGWRDHGSHLPLGAALEARRGQRRLPGRVHRFEPRRGVVPLIGGCSADGWRRW